jgi:hypothetical protein
VDIIEVLPSVRLFDTLFLFLSHIANLVAELKVLFPLRYPFRYIQKPIFAHNVG